MTVLRGLDPFRKGSVIQFLHESGLIDKEKCIISLIGADLIRAHLRGAWLLKADLGGVDLSEATMSRASLSGADLSGAHLIRTDLSGAYLKGAIGMIVEELEKQAKSLEGATLPNGEVHP